MKYKNLIIFPCCFIIFLIPVLVCASTSPLQLDIIDYSNSERQEYPTDKEIYSLATKKGVIPENITKDYFNQNQEEGNTLILWIIGSRKFKVNSIDIMKQMFQERENVTISNPSEYYADCINHIIHKDLQGDNIQGYDKKGIGTIFQTIAIQEGDFDTNDGRDAMEIMRDYWGEEEFEWYKKTYPEKLEALIKINKRDKQ